MTRRHATWERVTQKRSASVGYDGGLAAPEFWVCGDYFRFLESLKDHDDPDKLVKLGASARLTIDDTANVNTVGFLGATIVYTPWTFLGIFTHSFGGAPPAIGDYSQADELEASVAYDPISLPVGAVDKAIWTRTVTDPLEVIEYADPAHSTPGSQLWLFAYFQVNGSATTADAASCRIKWWWDDLDD